MKKRERADPILARLHSHSERHLVSRIVLLSAAVLGAAADPGGVHVGGDVHRRCRFAIGKLSLRARCMANHHRHFRLVGLDLTLCSRRRRCGQDLGQCRYVSFAGGGHLDRAHWAFCRDALARAIGTNAIDWVNSSTSVWDRHCCSQADALAITTNPLLRRYHSVAARIGHQL